MPFSLEVYVTTADGKYVLATYLDIDVSEKPPHEGVKTF